MLSIHPAKTILSARAGSFRYSFSTSKDVVLAGSGFPTSRNLHSGSEHNTVLAALTKSHAPLLTLNWPIYPLRIEDEGQSCICRKSTGAACSYLAGSTPLYT